VAFPAGTRALRPVLLSALVGPGAGQLAQRRYGPALVLIATTLVLLGVLVARVARETLLRMPTDPDALLDPVLPFALAGEIQRANAGFFTWMTAALVVLWIAGILDAWRAQR